MYSVQCTARAQYPAWKYVKVYLRSLSSNNLTMFSVPTFGWYCGTWCVVTKQNILFVCCKMQVCRFSIPIQREAKATHLCRHSCETHLSTPSYIRSFSGQRDRSLFVLAVSHCQSVRYMHPCAKKNVQSGHLAGRQNTLNRILHRTELCPKSIKSRRWWRQLEAMGKSFMAYYCSFYIMLESFLFWGPS